MQHSFPRPYGFSIFFSLMLTIVSQSSLATDVAKTPSSATETKEEKKATQTPLKDQELRGIQEKLKSFQHLKVSFTQQTYRSLRKKTSNTKGMAYFSKPDKFRWILQKPRADEWIFDGQTLSHFLPERKEAISYGSGAQKGKEFRQIVDMVMNFDNLLKRFDVKSATKESDSVLIVLEPRQKGGDIDKAHLTVDLKKNYIQVLQLFFGHGNHTTLNFASPERAPVADKIYQIPAGTKVTKAL